LSQIKRRVAEKRIKKVKERNVEVPYRGTTKKGGGGARGQHNHPKRGKKRTTCRQCKLSLREAESSHRKKKAKNMAATGTKGRGGGALSGRKKERGEQGAKSKLGGQFANKQLLRGGGAK